LRIRQRGKDEFLDSLIPFNNTRTLIKSFEKTSARGGKPLIKTHDKRFLIKEIKKEEKDFFLTILSEYHNHLIKNPNSLLAKILGVFSIQIDQKDKVYHILMESLDPIDDLFIKFKYDLKFSTVNRREYKSRQEVNLVRDELLQGNPLLEELFPKKNDFSTGLKQLPENVVIGADGKKISSSHSGSAENKSKEGKKSKSGLSKAKTKSTDSNPENAKKAKSNTNSDSEDDDSDDGGAKSGGAPGGNLEDEDDDLDNDEVFKQLDYEEQLIYREQKYLYRQ
jgi:hypothetical protein